MARLPRLNASEVRMLGAGHAVRVETGRGLWPSPPRSAVDGGPTRVLGLDLAARCTGWALLVGGQPAAHGHFVLPDRRRGEPLASWMMRRSQELGRQVAVLTATHRPEVVGFEVIDETRPSWSGGSKGREMVVSQALGRAQGALMAQWDRIAGGARPQAVPVTDAKRIATGRVNSNKDQVRQALMTMRRWDLVGWTDDEVDAAAVALAAREGVGA